MIKNYLRTAAERFQHSPYVSLIFNLVTNRYKNKILGCNFINKAIKLVLLLQHYKN